MMWNEIQNSLINVAFGSLLLTTFLYWLSFAFSEFKIIQKIGRIGIILANTLLFIFLASRWVTEGYFPLSNLYESLLFLTWTLLTIQLIAEYKTMSKIIGAIISPLALVLIGFSSLILPGEMQNASPLVPALQSNWLMMHVSMMMVSYATLIFGSLLSILFLVLSQGKDVVLNATSSSSNFDTPLEIQFSSNAQTLPGDILNVPSEPSTKVTQKSLKLLNNIDTWSYRTIGLGFPFLTFGIISGAVWANEAWGSYWSWDPKETWALITWLVFAVYMHARITKNWQGRKTAIVGSFGFFVIWICYLGVNFIGKGLHSYGWIS